MRGAEARDDRLRQANATASAEARRVRQVGCMGTTTFGVTSARAWKAASCTRPATALRRQKRVSARKRGAHGVTAATHAVAHRSQAPPPETPRRRPRPRSVCACPYTRAKAQLLFGGDGSPASSNTHASTLPPSACGAVSLLRPPWMAPRCRPHQQARASVRRSEALWLLTQRHAMQAARRWLPPWRASTALFSPLRATLGALWRWVRRGCLLCRTRAAQRSAVSDVRCAPVQSARR